MGKDESSEKKFPWSWVAVVAVVIALAFAWYLLPVDKWMDSLKSWIDGLGPLGYVAFGLIYALATAAMAPGAPFSIAAGLLFGFWGIAVVLLGATAGAFTSFLIGRFVARDRVLAWIEGKPKLDAVQDVVKEEGWKIAFMVRLSPVIPFNIQNYVFGVTEIPWWHYLLATFFGIIPGSSLYVYLGTLGRNAGEGGALRWTLIGVGLVATFAVVVYVSKKAQAKLAEHDARMSDDDSENN